MKPANTENTDQKVMGIKCPYPPIFPLQPENPPTFYQRVCISIKKFKAAIQRA